MIARSPFPYLAALALAAPAVLSAQDQQDQGEKTSWTVHADTVYTAAGDPIEDGFVRVENGKIAAVSKGTVPGDALSVAAVTPGLIDLSVRIDTGAYSVEQSNETPASLSVAESLDLFSYLWKRELDGGVTTVLATPQDDDVIGGLAVVIKTGGEPTLEARLVKADAVLRASMGSQPSNGNRAPRGTPPRDFYYRRPTTRMGTEWEFRNAFWNALNARKAGDLGEGHQRARNETVLKAIDGELPVAVQAWATQDIRTAIYLKEEFQIPRMFVDAAAEAWREPDLLVRSGMGVVLPPFVFNGRTTDGAFFAWDTAKMLHDLGVPFALSGQDARDPGLRLARQPGLAMRGGLPFDAALEAVTIAPARMVGVDDRVGSIEVGKDADLVLWSGKPFEATSRVVGVLLDGRLVLDPRAGEAGE